jgi:hypothetical protein
MDCCLLFVVEWEKKNETQGKMRKMIRGNGKTLEQN